MTAHEEAVREAHQKSGSMYPTMTNDAINDGRG